MSEPKRTRENTRAWLTNVDSVTKKMRFGCLFSIVLNSLALGYKLM